MVLKSKSENNSLRRLRVARVLLQTMVDVDTNGEAKYFICTLTDINDLHNTRTTLQKRQEELARYERLSSLQELTTDLAHELNQPLSAIVHYIGGSLTYLEQYDIPEKVRAKLKLAMDKAEWAGNLIHHIRSFLQTGETQREYFEIPILIHDTIQFLAFQFERHNIKVDICDDQNYATRIFVLADQIQIQQVLLNVLNNAIQALTTLKRKKHIAIQTLCSEKTVTIRICNSGPPIPLEEQNSIFEPFHSTRKTGMGMGLSLARKFTQAHGGNLRVNPEVTKGCEFILDLPLAKTS